MKQWFRALLIGISSFLAFPALADRLPFMVPEKTIKSGQVIEDENLQEKLFYIKREAAHLYAGKAIQVAGKVARKTLLAGKPIALNAVAEPLVIERGQSVQMTFRSGLLTISSIGVALSNASIGDVIRLRNADSGVVVSGRVREDATIEIGTP